MKKVKKIFFVVVFCAGMLTPAIAHAELIGRYSWGFFYSVMTKNRVTAEVDTTTRRKVRAVAQNSRTTKYGPLVSGNRSSIATVSRTSHGNKTFYRFN